MKRSALVIALSGLLLSPLAMAKNLDVVASFSVLGDMVSQIGGEHVTVTDLVPPNGDPHEFEPSPKDSKTLASANVVFVSGLGLEGWMNRLIKASGYKGPIVTASTGIHRLKMDEDGKTVTDPHAWNSMGNGIVYAHNIIDALVKADPQNADYYRQHGESYVQQLQKLDDYAKKTFASIPKEKRKVLTSHDAFGYFSAAYGVTFLAPMGYSTESEASSQTVAKLITQIKQEHVKSYFIENQTDPRLVKQIANASGAKPGGELFPEALTDSNGPAPTYTAAFKHNVDTIAASME
ncbi:metal ABC transporter substrate-binding protein [Pectobacteriaceae bacterium CE70]|uniref:Metal ABC transporter substrate-binding protein n=1 Tax=Serratia sp. (strain ATCC 39006) TaxID=104623 RepID=A0A2I5TGV2_SERS3|nr:metal ABC transporter substrate-binding protein [Serratia sp. ATCC 39006]WJV61928.1 metal ABC transporter substrate-binding protein [Pectobacteriaceae bacterium C52]WJV66199.1 metal ABC transporter substrate-binding protein [Pectobacteriaceae bacterium CE70]WJY10208.1 metal ABC transporter substrate-binding protein [Pectobacteriaceae bacterium C80]AUG99484.1 metal ABC transporter substrate-binding protein [Serratia sp. ATCC 39006]AUH03802.1 metal ABC transporter substrate-binding protein [S